MKINTKITAAVLVFILISSVSIAAGGNSEKTGDTNEAVNQNLIDYNWSAPGFSTDFTRMLIDPAEILSGGPSKDGIPALDHPSYTSAEDAGVWLAGNEPVILVRIGEQARIYPLQILMWHEIVNDELNGVPLTVTFCPLCNTGIAFNRNHSGKILDFGTTGRLRNSNLIMYDRQTESWWQQATGEALIGEYAGDSLQFIPSLTLSFSDAHSAAPSADILSRDTGISRPYGNNPYSGYDTSGNTPFLFRGRIDPEHDAMDRVLVLMHNKEERIVAYSEVKDKGFLQVTIGGDPIVIFWTSGTSSALDSAKIADGKNVGSLNAFMSESSGNRLNFTRLPDGKFTDTETGSIWNGSGIAINGTLTGERLEPVVGVQHFWFSAQAF